MKFILYFFKRLSSYSGKILYINILGMGLISLLDGMGIFLLIPLLSASGIMGLNNVPSRLLNVIRVFQDIPQKYSLPIILILFIFLGIGQNLLQRNLTIRQIRIISGFMHYIRFEIYQTLLFSNWGFFTRKKKTDLINILTTEFSRVTGGINLFIQFLTSVIFTLIQIGFALWISPIITTFVLISGIFLSFFSKKYIKRSKLLGNKTSKLAEEYLSGISDQLNGIKDIKSNNLEDSRLMWLRVLSGKMLDEQIEIVTLKYSSQLFYKTVSTILIAFFIFFSVNMFHAQPGQFLIIIVIFSRIWPRITNTQSNLEQIAASIPAFKYLINLKNECIDATELGNKINGNIKVEKTIECQNISFRYNQNESHFALKNINLKINSNQMTAIVGRSGAGKSTLIDILMGLNVPESGKVLLDGIPLKKENLFSLRGQISYVPQDPFLFNGSIRDNLLLVEPQATEEQLWDALEFAAASQFVKKLSKGLDTIIGDRGVRLSGGECQRLVLARGILRKPSILVLDEATSALDTENEAKIQDALERLKGKMTIIVIAHRLSTIRNAEQVIVLDQGEIIQQGQFSQLANEKRGMFNHLLKKQMEVSV